MNELADVRLDVAKAFFRTTQVEGDTLHGYRHGTSPESCCPLLVDTPYWFEARVTDTIKRGDHTVVVAEVVGAGVRDESRPPLSLRATGMDYGG